MAAITTHVLDTSIGQPAVGVPVVLERREGDSVWVVVGRGQTDADGRIRGFSDNAAQGAGVYRLVFETGAYFRARRADAFFPFVSIVFDVANASAHYHVPLLLSPFGYSTYRGS